MHPPLDSRLMNRPYRERDARRALLNTSQPISEVAYDSGFSDYTHFARKFRRRFGRPSGRRCGRRGHVVTGSSDFYFDNAWMRKAIRARTCSDEYSYSRPPSRTSLRSAYVRHDLRLCKGIERRPEPRRASEAVARRRSREGLAGNGQRREDDCAASSTSLPKATC